MSTQGTATLDFGAFPGASDASLAITGQAGILAGSLVEAWLLPAATTDHSADEHLVEHLKIIAGSIVAGTGFTIYGISDNQVPVVVDPALPVKTSNAPLIYGKWNVAWIWN